MGSVGRDVSVVVVDDQRPFRLAAKTVVRMTPGFVLSGEAESGEEALARVDELQPDLVLMDINMPGISGIESTRQLIAKHPDLTVILLSTYPPDDLPADALSCGAAGYVNKDEFGPDVLTKVWAAG
jgi:two-component system, NarL family, invasion response regulator UvrY